MWVGGCAPNCTKCTTAGPGKCDPDGCPAGTAPDASGQCQREYSDMLLWHLYKISKVCLNSYIEESNTEVLFGYLPYFISLISETSTEIFIETFLDNLYSLPQNLN